MRKLLRYLDRISAVFLSDARGLIKELQNCLARSVELIGVSGGRTRGSGRKGDDGLLFMSWALVAPVANPSRSAFPCFESYQAASASL